MSKPKFTEPTLALKAIMAERIMIIDGAMGSLIQRQSLTEDDFRGDHFPDHHIPLKGNNDLLCLTRPELIKSLHRQYLEVGADIIETNTFSAQVISMADYELEHIVHELNVAAARIAREACLEFMADHPGRRCFVAGSIGPTTRTLSLSPDVNRPAFRAITFDELKEAYFEQAKGLLAGGVDVLLIETCIDTLNVKAAILACQEAMAELDHHVGLIISMTITDASGRTLSGQTVEAFWASIKHAKPLSISLNCALGPDEMRPYVEEMSRIAPVYMTCYPNAGLPNEFGGYDLSPEAMAKTMLDYAQQGWINIAGGCCGTTPDHVGAIAQALKSVAPRVVPEPSPYTQYAGLEPLTVRPDTNFLMVGERTNVTGSRRFERLIRSEDYETAVVVARDQVEGGANIIDVNLDDGMIDGPQAMTTFLNIIATEPDIARVPVMIDSSRFEILEAGLKCVQGKAIVNSISLKDGHEEFVRRARLIQSYGAAVVVMAFDEHGQATEIDHKVKIAQRAYKILTEEVGLDPRDLIFDLNILTVATGMDEHNDYAINFIEAVREVKRLMPQVKTIGGVSNISFSFRGNDHVREAIHAAFLYHAISAGLDMGIVNAGQLAVYEDIEPALLEHVEDVLFNRRPDATERLVTLAEGLHGLGKERKREDVWRTEDVSVRLAQALVRGNSDYMDEDLEQALARYDRPLDIIEGPLMDGMRIVGERFGAGKMFLPQVVKSARAMKKAVAILMPYMQAGEAAEVKKQGKILLATVKGDVHDIGKNIVGVVLSCNNYEVIDLGVMVPANLILQAARDHQVDAVGLSGLITPSLDEMVHVARELEREGFNVPLLIGGATTSRKHTSIKISPHYEQPTVHVLDASRVVSIVGSLMHPERRGEFLKENEALQSRDREIYANRDGQPLLTYSHARATAPKLTFDAQTLATPEFYGVRKVEVELAELVPFIDWTPFFITWGLRDVYPRILESAKYGEQARELLGHARELLDRIVNERLLKAEGVYGFFHAQAQGDDIILYTSEEDAGEPRELMRWCTLRQQRALEVKQPVCKALSDFVAPVETGLMDSVGAFAVTTGIGLEALLEEFKAEGDDYNAIMASALADRLAEAFAEHLHLQARKNWGYGHDEALSPEELIRERYRGIRPAPGYPACPDHTEKRKLWSLLKVDEHTQITLTESCAMWPGASVSGLYFAHPDSHYFTVGLIGKDQVKAYAARKNMSVEDVERWLMPNLGYEP